MKNFLLNFLSRFRQSTQDQRRPRTMAESQNEDLQNQNPDSVEQKAFDEGTYRERPPDFFSV
jgi:hypothetical protein